MLYREQTQFMVFPRTLQCLKFSYKGEYFFKFQLYHQSHSGTKKWGYPYLVKPDQNPKIVSQKKIAKTVVDKGEGTFEARRFDILFENETIEFKEACVFNLETKVKTHNKGFFILTCELLKQSTKLVENPHNPKLLEARKSLRSAWKTTLRISCQHDQINQFYSLVLSDTDYFGTLHLYVGSVWLGHKIRRNQMSLCQFVSLEGTEKKRILEEAQQNRDKRAKTAYSAGKLIRNVTKDYFASIMGFYTSSKVKAEQEYLRLAELSSKVPLTHSSIAESALEKELTGYSYFRLDDLQEYYETEDPVMLYFYIEEETRELVSKVREAWQLYIKQIMSMESVLFTRLCKDESKKLNEAWDQISVAVCDAMPLEERQGYIKRFKRARKEMIRRCVMVRNQFFRFPLFMSVRSMATVRHDSEQSWNVGILGKKSKSLVIFVHGYQGSSFDLEKASNYLVKNNPQAEVLLVKSMEDAHEKTIDEIAMLVAEEIKTHIKNSYFAFNSISLVGYSLGGIVCRALLTHLDVYKNRFNMLVTFSSPHLGTFSSDNSLVRAGIWFMIKFNRAPALEQLHCGRDMNTCSKSYIKMLSQQESLTWFKKIVLASCREDEFVPHASSSLTRGGIEDEELAEIETNIRDRARCIQQLQIWFDVEKEPGTLDRLTGRRAHIEFLDNDPFLDYFFRVYGSQF